ncbi:MAG: L,D-transpeptidase family protein [Actinomycetota bacterium]
MRRLLKIGMVALLAAAMVVVDAGAGLTQESPTGAAVDAVTLEASSSSIEAGDEVTLSGVISPPSAGVEVSIVGTQGEPPPPLTTAEDGTFSILLSPGRTTTYKATAEGVESEPVTIEVLNRRITLGASRRTITVGDGVRLTGAVSPAEAGQEVEIVRLDTGRAVRALTTASNGRFSSNLAPRRTLRYQARIGNVRSETVRLGVRAKAGIKMRRVDLFGRALVLGGVRPSSPETRVKVTIFRNGKQLLTRRPRLREGRRYRARFHVARPGSYRARVLFDDPTHLAARDSSGSKKTSLPSLREGSTGSAVKRLERRLRSLGYHLPSADRSYTHQTHDAVVAFNKVQGRVRVGSVDGRTWRALAEARRPRARLRIRGFHIEVDQTKQVLYIVRDRKVRKILHVSTGGAGVGVTRDGNWRVHRRLAGFSPGRLYYPSYFDGLRAIHGWPEVPPTAASHGCVRVPMWTARWIFDQTRVGTLVHIYHS